MATTAYGDGKAPLKIKRLGKSPLLISLKEKWPEQRERWLRIESLVVPTGHNKLHVAPKPTYRKV